MYIYEEREGLINMLVYMGKWQALVGVKPKFAWGAEGTK